MLCKELSYSVHMSEGTRGRLALFNWARELASVERKHNPIGYKLDTNIRQIIKSFLLIILGFFVITEGEMRVVLNTDDPDYEHIYTYETYDDEAIEEIDFTTSVNKSDGNESLH